MPLHHLAPSSIQSLTATQVLTTPPTLIKELIENSLDARATTIAVEVSPNCIDILQVKDNGHGILPGEDRECVAKRWWTSKISTWDEIGSWKGDTGTLGFRGEALASAAEMAGKMMVTTRVEGERIGQVCGYDRAGKMIR